MKLLPALIILLLTITEACATPADYSSAAINLKKGQYQTSFQQLLHLAKLGYAPAQIRLAESYAKGYGTKVDFQSAYAWALMAKEQNHPMAESLYLAYRLELTSRRAGKQLYQQLNQKYGQAALKADLYPLLHAQARAIGPQPDPLKTPDVEFPTEVYEKQLAFWAIVQFDVNEDGHTENIKILADYPESQFGQQILDTFAKWRFKPVQDAQNNPMRFDLQTRLVGLYPEQSTFVGSPEAKDVLKRAKNGDAFAQYLLAKLIGHEIISNSYGTALEWLTKAAINGFGPAQFELYQCASQQSHCKAEPHKAMKWLKMAQQNGEKRAEIQLARALMNTQGQDTLEAKQMLEGLIQSNHLPALILYAKLLATSENPDTKDSHQAIKYAQQAMALDNNHPQLLGVLAVAHFDIGQPNQAQDFLVEAIKEAEYRRWPIDYYVNLLEAYQRATLLGEQTPAVQEKGN